MRRLGAIICRFIGHRFDIVGFTGRFEWCSRCGLRHEQFGKNKGEVVRFRRPEVAK